MQLNSRDLARVLIMPSSIYELIVCSHWNSVCLCLTLYIHELHFALPHVHPLHWLISVDPFSPIIDHRTSHTHRQVPYNGPTLGHWLVLALAGRSEYIHLEHVERNSFAGLFCLAITISPHLRVRVISLEIECSGGLHSAMLLLLLTRNKGYASQPE